MQVASKLVAVAPIWLFSSPDGEHKNGKSIFHLDDFNLNCEGIPWTNFNFKRLYSTQIYKGKSKTCVLHGNAWRLLSRYMHTAWIRATKEMIHWITFILHTITYDQMKQTSNKDAQNLSQWRTVWIMGHEWFDVRRKYKGSGQSNGVQCKIYKPICRLYEIVGAF